MSSRKRTHIEENEHALRRLRRRLATVRDPQERATLNDQLERTARELRARQRDEAAGRRR